MSDARLRRRSRRADTHSRSRTQKETTCDQPTEKEIENRAYEIWDPKAERMNCGSWRSRSCETRTSHLPSALPEACNEKYLSDGPLRSS